MSSVWRVIDDFGHAFGNAVLQAFAESLNKFLRNVDSIASVGDDEFIFVLSNVRKVVSLERPLHRTYVDCSRFSRCDVQNDKINFAPCLASQR